MSHIRFVVLPLLLLSAIPSLAWAGKSDDVADLKRIQDANSQLLAETNQQVGSLRQEVQELRGIIDEIRHAYEEETQKNQKLMREFDFRITGIEEKIFIQGSQLQDLLTPSAGGKGKVKVSPEEETLYNKALSEVNLKNYKGAMGRFEQFLKKYPKSSLTDNAHYWKGEILYAQKDFQNAILAFQNVVKLFPKSSKAPAAVLKQGYSFFELKNYPDAQVFLQKVITDYATSDEAGLAQEKIAQIQKILAAPSSSPSPESPTKPVSPVSPNNPVNSTL